MDLTTSSQLRRSWSQNLIRRVYLWLNKLKACRSVFDQRLWFFVRGPDDNNRHNERLDHEIRIGILVCRSKHNFEILAKRTCLKRTSPFPFSWDTIFFHAQIFLIACILCRFMIALLCEKCQHFYAVTICRWTIVSLFHKTIDGKSRVNIIKNDSD